MNGEPGTPKKYAGKYFKKLVTKEGTKLYKTKNAINKILCPTAAYCPWQNTDNV